MSSSGTTLFAGRYRVVDRLGAGGTASVFLTLDERLGREVAVKRLHGAEVTAQTSQRLRREARIMASLRHPNLLTVYDMLMEDRDLLLVMEYVPGVTLGDALAAAPLDWKRTSELLEPVAAALDHVHGHGVVHRDLKPSNVLVGRSGVVKVADLGLATAADITKITPPGAVLGTPAYMAPEQAHAVPCTPAVDVYALGTIAFQALAGALPRDGKTLLAVLAQATREPPPDLRDHRPDAPEAAAEALKRAMSARPEERQRSASQLLDELAGAFADGTVAAPARPPAPAVRPAAAPAARPAPRPARNRRARVLALVALAAGVAAVLVLVAVLRSEPASSPPPRAQATPAPEPSATATPDATPAPPRPLSAAATVRAFYRRAAAGNYAGAWRLAGPGMRAAFGNSFERFRGGLSSLRAIEFERLAVVGRESGAATVEIRSVATHDDRIDRCSGTLRTVRNDRDRWLVEPAGVQCASGRR